MGSLCSKHSRGEEEKEEREGELLYTTKEMEPGEHEEDEGGLNIKKKRKEGVLSILLKEVLTTACQ